MVKIEKVYEDWNTSVTNSIQHGANLIKEHRSNNTGTADYWLKLYNQSIIEAKNHSEVLKVIFDSNSKNKYVFEDWISQYRDYLSTLSVEQHFSLIHILYSL